MAVEAMDAGTVAEIRERLAAIARSENVAIPLAVESGSRAWGFPSPDSDYDCRFVYLRSLARTFTLFPARDVIETPVTAIFDVNGWELSKALRLLLKGNAVIIEWLTSPLTYISDPVFRNEFLCLAEQATDRRLLERHYYHLARRQTERWLSPAGDVGLKKLLHVLRPLMALRWLDEHPGEVIPPMNFPELCAASSLPAELGDSIRDLLARKARTRELGQGPIPPPIQSFVSEALGRAEPGRRTMIADRADATSMVDAFWRRWLERLAPPDRPPST